MPVSAPRVCGEVEISEWRLSHEYLCVCGSVCIVMSQEVKPCEDSNIHWGYITLMGVER